MQDANSWYAVTFNLRIAQIARITLVSYQTLNDALHFYALQFDCDVNDCLDYIDSDVIKLAKLVKCAHDKRLCYAVKSRGDQTLTTVLDS